MTKTKNQKTKLSLRVILIGAAGIIGIYLLSTFFTNTYKLLDSIGQVHLSELLAALIGITIIMIRKKTKTEKLENLDLLMLVMIAVIASYSLISHLLTPILIIILPLLLWCSGS